MRLLIPALLSIVPATLSAQTTKLMKLQDERCVRLSERVGKPRPRPEAKAIPRKLGEMPPARGYYTVYREAGGCPVPAAVGSGARKR